MNNADILAFAGLRVDGRRADELRSLRMKFNATPDADGSVYFEQGLNKILVNVHGPREPPRRPDDDSKGILTVAVVNAPFSGSDWKKRGKGDRRNAEIERTIRDTFEGVVLLSLYPKSEISVVIHLLESDGSVLCAMINAVSLALINAAVAMSDMVVSCSIGYEQKRKELIQDASQVEQGSGGAYLPIAIKVRSEDILLIQLDSRLDVDVLESAMQMAIEGCRKLSQIFEKELKEHMQAHATIE